MPEIWTPDAATERMRRLVARCYHVVRQLYYRWRMRIWRMGAGKSFIVSPTDHAPLSALIDDRNSPKEHVWRARIVLLTADGLGTVEIKRRVGKSKKRSTPPRPYTSMAPGLHWHCRRNYTTSADTTGKPN